MQETHLSLMFTMLFELHITKIFIIIETALVIVLHAKI